MYTARQPSTLASGKPPTPRPFALVAPLLGAALLAGAAEGFVFATVLTLSLAFNVSLGLWWAAVVQAYGHLQLDGWAGLFVLGVALLFPPRMHGVPWLFPGLFHVGSHFCCGMLRPYEALRMAGMPMFCEIWLNRDVGDMLATAKHGQRPKKETRRALVCLCCGERLERCPTCSFEETFAPAWS